MVCKNCGIELKENEKFCPQCGQAATPVETSKPELETPKVETPENQPPKGSTSESGTAKPQSAQWDTVKENLRQGAEKAAPILKAGFGKAKENLQQGAEKAAPILKAGFGKAKEFTAQTVHEFKDAAADVKGAGVSGASVAVAAKKINWKRLIPVAVALVLLVFVVRACGGGGSSIIRKDSYNGKDYACLNLKIEDFTKKYNQAYAQACSAAGINAIDNLSMDSWTVTDVSADTFGNLKQYAYSRQGLLGDMMFTLSVTTNRKGYICTVSALYNAEQVMGSDDFSGASIHGLLYATNKEMNNNKEALAYSGLNFGTPGNVNMNGLMFDSEGIVTKDGLAYLGDKASLNGTIYYTFAIGAKG